MDVCISIILNLCLSIQEGLFLILSTDEVLCHVIHVPKCISVMHDTLYKSMKQIQNTRFYTKFTNSTKFVNLILTVM